MDLCILNLSPFLSVYILCRGIIGYSESGFIHPHRSWFPVYGYGLLWLHRSHLRNPLPAGSGEESNCIGVMLTWRGYEQSHLKKVSLPHLSLSVYRRWICMVIISMAGNFWRLWNLFAMIALIYVALSATFTAIYTYQPLRYTSQLLVNTNG